MPTLHVLFSRVLGTGEVLGLLTYAGGKLHPSQNLGPNMQVHDICNAYKPTVLHTQYRLRMLTIITAKIIHQNISNVTTTNRQRSTSQ